LHLPALGFPCTSLVGAWAGVQRWCFLLDTRSRGSKPSHRGSGASFGGPAGAALRRELAKTKEPGIQLKRCPKNEYPPLSKKVSGPSEHWIRRRPGLKITRCGRLAGRPPSLLAPPKRPSEASPLVYSHVIF